MSDVKRLNFTVSQFESVVPYASEHGQYVRFADYAKLEAEAQALREELKNRTSECNGLHEMLRQEHDRTEKARDEVAALRARVVVTPERKQPISHGVAENSARAGFNECLDELARLNGKAVSEGLLHKTIRSVDDIFWAIHAKPSCQSGVVARCRCRLCAGTRLAMARNDLNALLGEGKEVDDVLVRE